MADTYNDVLKKRQEQDQRLKDFYDTTTNSTTETSVQDLSDIEKEKQLQDELSMLLATKKKQASNEQTLDTLIKNPASDINSREDLLNLYTNLSNKRSTNDLAKDLLPNQSVINSPTFRPDTPIYPVGQSVPEVTTPAPSIVPTKPRGAELLKKVSELRSKNSPQISISKDLLSNTPTQVSDEDYQKVGDEGFEDLANPKLQQVDFDKPNAMGMELNPNQVASANLKSVVTGGPDTRDEDKIIDSEGKVITREENARREAIDEGRLPPEPPKPLTDTVSTTKAAPMTDEEKLAEAQRQRDIMAAIGLISGGISKAAAGYGGGSVTQLKADTTGQDLLTQMGERGVADIKESMARASDKKKQELEDLLKKAQAAKLQFEASGKMTDKEKADVAFKNAQLGLERLKLIQETTKPQKLSQDEINTRKENRKVYREVDADKTKSQSLLDEIKQARQAFEEYSKSKFGGTGPLATAFGTTANISEDSQKLRSKFNKLSLGNMTKLFSGFSKAIDTDAERAFFQSTQPDLSLDDDVNREILKNMEDYAKGLVDKANMRQAEITKEGDFRSPEETLSEYQKLAGKNTSYPKQMTKGGKQVTVSNSQEENEARQEGWN